MGTTATKRLMESGMTREVATEHVARLRVIRADLTALLSQPEVGCVYTRSGSTAGLPTWLRSLVWLRRARTDRNAARRNAGEGDSITIPHVSWLLHLERAHSDFAPLNIRDRTRRLIAEIESLPPALLMYL